jgi:hypothetical protein
MDVVYQLGKHNWAVDALSRLDEDTLSLPLFALCTASFELFDALRAELTIDPRAQELRAQISSSTAPDGWTEVDNLLLFHGKAYVPDNSSLWQQLLDDAHAAGHEGIQKTLHRLCLFFFNPHINHLVREFIKRYTVCQRNKSEHLHPAGLL